MVPLGSASVQDPVVAQDEQETVADIKTLAGMAVASACDVPFKAGEAAGLRGSFRGQACIGAWRVGPDEETSEEDEDGYVKPRRGEGRLGRGSPMQSFHNGSERPYVDGCGLCSPTRWLPADRILDTISSRMRRSLSSY